MDCFEYVKSNEMFEKVFEENKKVIVIYSATWCGPCRTFKKWLHDTYETYPYPILIVDVEELPELAEDVKALPTMMVYKDNEVIIRTEGFDKQKMKDIFDKLTLDESSGDDDDNIILYNDKN